MRARLWPWLTAAHRIFQRFPHKLAILKPSNQTLPLFPTVSLSLVLYIPAAMTTANDWQADYCNVWLNIAGPKCLSSWTELALLTDMTFSHSWLFYPLTPKTFLLFFTERQYWPPMSWSFLQILKVKNGSFFLLLFYIIHNTVISQRETLKRCKDIKIYRSIPLAWYAGWD